MFGADHGVLIRERKQAMRRQVLDRLALLDPEARAQASRNACEILRSQKAWKTAQTILFYAPFKDEIDIWPLVTETLSRKALALLPRFCAGSGCYEICPVVDLDRDVRSGRFGIREAASHCEIAALKRLDFALVPGVAFDLNGRRLGRGKGFYDQLLAGVGDGFRCGVAHEEQLVPEVPIEPHDIVLNCILTPRRWIELGRAVLE